MKFYNPFKVSDRNKSITLIASILVLFLSLTFLAGLILSSIPSFYIVILVTILAIIRVLYAVVKGD